MKHRPSATLKTLVRWAQLQLAMERSQVPELERHAWELGGLLASAADQLGYLAGRAAPGS